VPPGGAPSDVGVYALDFQRNRRKNGNFFYRP
jgi:hypothetical protein